MILALDTATPYLVLGLPHLGRTVRLGRRHAEVLWAELEGFLHEAGVDKAQLRGIAVGRGPGSYTGLRVGIAAGLGLGRGLGIRVVGVDTLQGVALKYTGHVTVAHLTRNGLCYTASYQVHHPLAQAFQPPHKARLAELQPAGLLSIDEPPSGPALSLLGRQALERGDTGIEALYL